MSSETQNLPKRHNAPKIENPVIYVPIRHYICREPSTNQPFLCKTNPILSAVGGLQMNVNIYNTTDYESKSDWTLSENKPNSNPIKPNLRKAEMNINSIITKGYRKNDDFVVRINKPNLVRRRRIANERKLNFNKGLQKKRLFSTPKNKPNTNPIKAKFRTLFPLTARPVRKKTLSSNGAGDYNEIFSQMSFFQRTPNERV